MIMPILTRTPVQRLELPDEGGNRFWIKRDDLLPFSFGGNKVRIAKAFLEDCTAKGCDAMILYGDRRSNLCRVLGALCRAAGMECVMIATSEHEEAGPEPFNEQMIRSLGIRILPCEKNAIADAVDAAMELLAREGKKPYYIYGNRLGQGNEAAAVSAYADASRELFSWKEESGVKADYVFTACGTGSTLAGLACGMTEGGSDARIVGISISSRSAARAEECVQRAVEAWYGREGKTVPHRLRECLSVECGYNCGGYGVRDGRVDDLIRTVFETSSVPLDPTYTGKAMRGMLDYLEEKKIREKDILFLHTGGTPLFYDSLLQRR